MRRIIIAGSQGSGKTRLALNLGRKLAIPVIHLDALYWLPGWKESDKASFRTLVANAVAGEAWVVDGSYSDLAFDLTLARADTLIIIERPRWLCQWRILRRSVCERSTKRSDLPIGCPEKIDWQLMREAWLYDNHRRPQIEAEIKKYGEHVNVVRLTSDSEIEVFLDKSRGRDWRKG